MQKAKYFFTTTIALSVLIFSSDAQTLPAPKTDFLDPSNVVVKGLLGDEIAGSVKGRLTALPSWNNGELITIFSKEVKDAHDKTDWYGEHGGKWLYTTALAARQTGDKQLETLLFRTADYLVSTQDADGYLAVYSPKIRITNNEASHKRSWDVWNLSYMTLGLLEVNRYFPNPKYLNAAKGVGELFLKQFGDGTHDITDYGTRRGISATVILDPIVELFKATNDKRYLDLAGTIMKEMEAKEGLKLISVSLANGDMENVGDGKAYQILWTLTAIAKLYEVTGNADYLKAVSNAWQNIADHHLTITGGPWGGIGKHMECFNRKNYFSPYGFVETCSTMSWIQLNKQLLHLTGEAKYAQEIEKSAYNSLLGARYANGMDWTYHSFTNGSWHVAHFNDCCPSSGIMALEELPSMIYSKKGNGLAVNLFTESEATISLNNTNPVRISQKTQYPFEGKIQIEVSPSKKLAFPLSIRIPDWVSTATININGKPVDVTALKKGEFFVIDRAWTAKDMIDIDFPLELTLHKRSEQADVPQGGGEIFNVSWVSMTRGPLVFSANGLIDGKDRERALSIGSKKADELFIPATRSNGSKGPAYELKLSGQQALLFLPYYESGDRKPGQWRLTWMESKIE